ncbi:thioredoxin family protein [Dinghuibacter silviterrae]|uniref:AhpC/TSA family protein n=1 Tax=Dinghuibacter silviterrae TaxID=1539049 RepID=A0A4R8DTE9_9BACT|nr:thioredoxin family protein [Dinghuibacter silviterrae]TDX01554.1 AhpC/TSA family protein [Dinghuibacter silviterrae]
MKRLTTLLFAAGLLAFAMPTPMPIGSTLPDTGVKMKDVSGKMVSFTDVRKANGLLVMFSCNTCPVVRGYQQRTKDICAYALAHRVGVILLNANEAQRDYSDSYSAMQAYAKDQQYQWPYVIDQDSKMANTFGASRTPECFLFDASGKLVYEGAIDNNPGNADGVTRAHLRVAMEEMLGGKEVSVKESRSVGCQIKRM